MPLLLLSHAVQSTARAFLEVCLLQILCGSIPKEPVKDAVPQMVAHLQTTYADEVFLQLPASDQLKKKAQKEIAIVQGKPADPVKDMPVVMMRDWFQRGLDKKRKELLKEFTDVAKAAVGAATHKDLLFGKKVSSCKIMGPMFRAMIQREKYYEVSDYRAHFPHCVQ